MPGWHERTKKLQESGKIQLVGIVQEQHAERCRLFKQWHQFDWPILVDSLNLYGLPVIPIAMAVDEHGILRSSQIRPGKGFQTFLNTKYEAPKTKSEPKDYRKVLTGDRKPSSTSELMELATAEYLVRSKDSLDRAIKILERVVAQEPTNAKAQFRLGVALRTRLDSESHVVADFERASRAWSKALELNSGQYIWRRRIQQFGPRMDKPYNFYRWIAEAQLAIKKRGQKPVALKVPLTASEKMQRDNKQSAISAKNPDPNASVPQDSTKIARLSRAVVPAIARPGRNVRLLVLLNPNKKLASHWDHNGGPIQLWLESDKEWQRAGMSVTSDEIIGLHSARSIEIEVAIPKDAQAGSRTLKGFVLYPICEDKNGTCQYLRQPFEVSVEVKAKKK